MRTKTILSLLTGAAAFIPAGAMAANPMISGFLDSTYVLSDSTTDGVSLTENKFDTSAELDFESALSDKATVRLDADFISALASPFILEQGYLDWKTQGPVSIMAGKFNNPVGWEAEDAPDMYQVSHGQLYNLLDGQTILYGNNVIGLAAKASTGELEFVGGILNDLNNVDEQNSFMGLARFTGVESLNLELGLLTQDGQAESIIDFNGTFKQGPLTVGGELLVADKVYDMGLGVTASYQVNDKLTGTVRFDSVSYEANFSDTTGVTVAGSLNLGHNIAANAEVSVYSNSDAGVNPNSLVGDGSVLTLELLATF